MPTMTLPARSTKNCSCLILLLSALLSLTAHAAPAPPQVDASAWILMDYASGEILAQGNADERRDPASLTKIMTSYVTGQALRSGKIRLTDTVTINNDAWATGNPQLRGSSVMFLKPGDNVSVADLNRGIIIQSGNDASIALADHIAGSQAAFIELMNAHAHRLGLTNTHFATVHGLDAPEQYTSARDMAHLTRALIRDEPDEYAINKEKEFTFNNIRQINRNRLLWSTRLQVDGVKTGTTSGAGYNLVASAVQNQMRLIAVILGSKTDAIRFREAEKLLTFGFQHYETLTPAAGDITRQRVWFGKPGNVQLGVPADQLALTIPRGQAGKISASYTLDSPWLTAPLAQGQRVGSVQFIIDGKTIAERPLVALAPVEQAGFFRRLWDNILLKFQQWLA